jgi:hypothetical protein
VILKNPQVTLSSSPFWHEGPGMNTFILEEQLSFIA